MILMDIQGHLVSTKDSTELHSFAQRLGLLKRWYQHPCSDDTHAHYDLTTQAMKDRAEAMGAKLVTGGKLIRLAWWNKRSGWKLKKGGD